VPYRGQGPALTDLLAGQVQFYFAGIPSSIQYVRSAKLRALAVTTATWSEALPEISSLSDFLPGYEVSFWGGFCAPKNTPAGVIETLNTAINAALSDPRMQARLADLGATPFDGSPGDFGKHIAEETKKWAKVIRAANIQPE
jgi:tripartite-type tricarboxylate transporter receptor subunit TctC